jgi:protein TonB
VSRTAHRDRGSRRYVIATILAAATWALFLARTQWLGGAKQDTTRREPIDMRVIVLPPVPPLSPVEPHTSETAQVPVRREAARPPIHREPRLPRPTQRSSMAPARIAPADAPAPQPVAQRDTPSPSVQAHSDAPAPASASQRTGGEARAPSGPVSKDARLLSQPLPQLPDDLREEGYQAVAVARFAIHADGTVDVDLLKPTPNPRLNQILLATLRQWRFFPAMEDGRPVESHRDVRVHFDVN